MEIKRLPQVESEYATIGIFLRGFPEQISIKIIKPEVGEFSGNLAVNLNKYKSQVETMFLGLAVSMMDRYILSLTVKQLAAGINEDQIGQATDKVTTAVLGSSTFDAQLKLFTHHLLQDAKNSDPARMANMKIQDETLPGPSR